jgi:hypothetical protein
VQVQAQFHCPCCGYKTLDTPGALALCPVCWWEDDRQEDDDDREVRLTMTAPSAWRRRVSILPGAARRIHGFFSYVRKAQVTEE